MCVCSCADPAEDAIVAVTSTGSCSRLRASLAYMRLMYSSISFCQFKCQDTGASSSAAFLAIHCSSSSSGRRRLREFERVRGGAGCRNECS
jgi:hypothetical protein